MGEDQKEAVSRPCLSPLNLLEKLRLLSCAAVPSHFSRPVRQRALPRRNMLTIANSTIAPSNDTNSDQMLKLP